MTTADAVNALQIKGNGGSISYFGNGGATDTTQAGLCVDNANGNVSIATGTSAISGATGINASTTGPGALAITTGSGLVSGTAGAGILASTANGALSVTVGSGGAAAVGHSAIDAIAKNGPISVTANGNVSANGMTYGHHDGIEAISKGAGNITIGGVGTIFAEDGRGIYAQESVTGLGGILITGTGDIVSGTAIGCCSGIRAEIDNPANSSNIIINRSGNISAYMSKNVVNSGIHAFTVGTGNVTVAYGAGTITNVSE